MGLISRGPESFVSTPRRGSDETCYPEVTKLPVGGSQGLLAGSSSLDRAHIFTLWKVATVLVSAVETRILAGKAVGPRTPGSLLIGR